MDLYMDKLQQNLFGHVVVVVVVVVAVVVKRGSLGIIWTEVSQKKTENRIPQTTADTLLNHKCFTHFVCVSRLFVVEA